MISATVWIYTLASVFIVSAISLIGIFTLSWQLDKLRKFLLYLVSFSAGALIGDAFIHLLPEIVEEVGGFTLQISMSLLLGIVAFFFVEKVIQWHHCHHTDHDHEKHHKHAESFGKMNLIGDGAHNFIDGIIIAGSYLVSIPVGIATTVAVLLHEIPQEIGDFGVLIHSGYSRGRALFYNFLSGLVAVIGAVGALLLQNVFEHVEVFLVPFAAGGFIYIAMADLVPELKHEGALKVSLMQLFVFVLGITVMAALLLFEVGHGHAH